MSSGTASASAPTPTTARRNTRPVVVSAQYSVSESGRQVAGAGGVVADAVIGEIETAMAVHHQIVRRPQRPAVALGVQIGDGAVVRIDPLDPTASVLPGHEGAREHHPAELGRGETPAVVAQVDRTVGTDRRSVGTALDLGDRRLGPVGRHPREPRPEHLDEHDRSVGHRDRPFRKPQAIGDLGEFGRELHYVGHGAHVAKAAPRSPERSRATLPR
jgi:hypothetical protein